MLPELNRGFIVRHDVDGAPLGIGARVVVAASALDESADERFGDRVGTVTGYVYDCPDEQYPHCPLVLVRVPGVGEDVFFVHELRVRAARVTARQPAATA
ncbi:MAG: Carotenogenesis protein CarS [Myxococcaceae bacterium]